MRYLAILASSRSDGHTREVLDAVLGGREVDLVDLSDFAIEPYSYPQSYGNDDFTEVMERFVAADVIILATPVYWYSLSAQLKLLFDRLSVLLSHNREVRGALVGKLCFAVATSESKELPEGFDVPFRDTCRYLGMRWGGCFHGHYRGERDPGPGVFAEAQRFGRLVFMED
jgi:multimeric flavodoxin WrbA